MKHETQNQLEDLRGVIAKSEEGRNALFQHLQPKIAVWESLSLSQITHFLLLYYFIIIHFTFTITITIIIIMHIIIIITIINIIIFIILSQSKYTSSFR
jgi:hypothetical protein